MTGEMVKEKYVMNHVTSISAMDVGDPATLCKLNAWY